MKAIRVHQHGGPDVLRVEKVPTPEPGPDEALVRIQAAGLNFIDVYERTGAYPSQCPFTPGREAAGVIEVVGEDVEHLTPGDRVAWGMHPGGYAEEAVLPAWKLVPVPEGVSTETAAAVMLQGLTAHYLAASTFPLQPGHTALVHAAAGGVGHLLVQIARLRGATVIGTVSTPEKAEMAREWGADHVIRYTEADFRDETLRLTDGEGVDVVYDSVGKTTFDRSLECLRTRGMMVLYGQSSGAVPPVDPQILNRRGSLFLTRPTLADHVSPDELASRSADLFGWIREGSLDVRIDQEYPLADAPDAHRYLEARKTKGKVLLLP